jgi:hypothetical protein
MDQNNNVDRGFIASLGTAIAGIILQPKLGRIIIFGETMRRIPKWMKFF